MYVDYIKALQLNNAVKANLHIVYTPLYGKGHQLVPQALQTFGLQCITMMKEQRNPDPNFLTVSSLYLQEAEAFELAIQYGH